MAPLTGAQESSLRALIDAFLPPIPAPEGSDDPAFWEDRISANPDFFSSLQVQDDEEMKRALTYLSTAVGTSLVFGKATWYPFGEWPVPERTALLQELRDGPVAARRRLFRQLQQMVCEKVLTFTATTKEGTNPYWDAIGHKPADDESKKDEEQLLLLSAAAASTDNAETLEYDVVIVGANPPGYVAASLLKAAGYSVCLVNEATPTPATTKDGTIRFVDDKSIERSAILPLPARIRNEWMRLHGLDAFSLNGPYQQAWQAVLHKVVVVFTSQQSPHQNAPLTNGTAASPDDDVLLAACKAGGLQWETVEPVTPDQQKQLGARGDELPVHSKDSASALHVSESIDDAAFLSDAVANGVHVLNQYTLEQVNTTPSETSGRSATGVTLQAPDESSTVALKARHAVILTGGALKTPAWLIKSRFQSRHIGQHLKLQPMVGVVGFGKTAFSQGMAAATRCTEFEYGPLEDGFGAFIECPKMTLSAIVSSLNWSSPVEFKSQLRRVASCLRFLVVQRDNTDGTLRLDGGNIEVDYEMTEMDMESMEIGIKGASRLLSLYGADEQSPLIGDWQVSTKQHRLNVFSNQPLGSCRMSSSPFTGVVDGNGELWDCDNLYVMDESLLPSSPGVNVKLIVMSIAWMLTTRLIRQLQYRDGSISMPIPVEAERRVQVSTRSKLSAGLDAFVRSSLALLILGLLVTAWFFQEPWWLANYQA